MIFEGLQFFTEFESKKESELKFWFPKSFPKNIRVIITANKSSKSYANILKRNSINPQIDWSLFNSKDILSSIQDRIFFMPQDYVSKIFSDIKELSEELYMDRTAIKTLISTFCPYETDGILTKDQVDLNKTSSILTSINVYEEYIIVTRFNEKIDYQSTINKVVSCLEDKIMDKQKFIEMMVYLSITFKGVTLQELFDLTGINMKEWTLSLVFFKTYISCYKETLWRISNDTLTKVIYERYMENVVVNGKPIIQRYYLNLGNQMNRTENSIRKLEEQTINYFFAQEYYLLKLTISDIENFLILFNPYTKYDLCRYWQHLEGQGYDPVIEYNKRLELFDLHFEPKPEDLFITILQISRFFKEFADFETNKTPKFRHPFIRDKFEHSIEHEDLSINKERDVNTDIFSFLRKVGYSDDDNQADEYGPKAPEKIFRQFDDDEEEYEDLKETMVANQIENSNFISFLSNIGLENEVTCMHMMENTKRKLLDNDIKVNKGKDRNSLNVNEKNNNPLKGHEVLNPDIPNQKVLYYNPRNYLSSILK